MLGTVGPIEWAAKAAFYGVAAATLFSAWVTVSARNLFRAALGLAGALFGVAVIYLFLEAEFLAVTQLLIYVGAILTLLIFGIMLTARIADPSVPRWNQQVRASLALALGLGLGLCGIFLTTLWRKPVSDSVPMAVLGRSLVSSYLLPFELLSILLLGALVGAMVIARKEEP